MSKAIHESLTIIDVQRGFMPASEGTRLGLHGFGQLSVPNGETIIPAINELTTAAHGTHRHVCDTRDWHPQETAHFSENPNYVDTWPVHCVAGTPGSELHPDLKIAKQTISMHFFKGREACASPEDDDSYTGVLAHNPDTGLLLPDFYRKHQIGHVILAGVALGDGDEHKLCVDSTAFDLKRQGFEVTVVTDAVEAVVAGNRQECLNNMAAFGIKLATKDQVLTQWQQN